MQCARCFRLTTYRLSPVLQKRASSTVTSAEPTFKQLGLPSPLLDALARAFPHIESPTPSQAALLQALIPPSQRKAGVPQDREAARRSLILRDVTGSGKSLALLLGLLAGSTAKDANPSTRRKARIDRLLLVPHTEVARQYEYWLELLRTCVNPPASSNAAEEEEPCEGTIQSSLSPLDVAHTVYKGQENLTVPPETDFLIATPSAFIEVVPKVDLAKLDTIALDEADAMLYLPNTRFGNRKEAAKWERHPPPLVSIMQALLANDKSDDHSQRQKKKVSTPAESIGSHSKRIIVVSATANSVLRDWIVRRSGWIGSQGVLGERQLDWYDFSGPQQEQQQHQGGAMQSVGRSLLPTAEIAHVFYRIDEEGMIASEAGLEPRLASPESAVQGSSSKGSRKGSLVVNLEPFFMAVSTLFALNRVISGLVIIPSSQSLSKTLAFFHSLEVPATTIEEARDLPSDEPRLYVVSSSSVRGLDIPALEQVYILPGTVEDAQSYLHVAGRVGRLGAGQKRPKGMVISLVRDGQDKEEERVKRFWELLGIQGKAGGDVPKLDGI